MEMKCCTTTPKATSNWSLGGMTHKYCHNCKSHLWGKEGEEPRLINRHDWAKWIDHANAGESFDDFMKRSA